MSGYFELRTPEDLIAKARRDLATFDKHPNGLDLWNAVVTANHVYDWVKHDKTLAKSAGGARPSKHTDSDIKLLLDLANGLKHFERRIETPSTSTRSVGSAVPGEAMLGEMILGTRGVPAYFATQPDGSMVEVRGVVIRVLDRWEKFLMQARP